jgi:hypothetical protein
MSLVAAWPTRGKDRSATTSPSVSGNNRPQKVNAPSAAGIGMIMWPLRILAEARAGSEP